MTEKLNLDDEFDEVVERNETTPEQDDAFVQSILGAAYEESVPEEWAPNHDLKQYPNKFKDIQETHDKQHKKYYTKGGKEVRMKKDEWGSFWRVEFVGGGQLPAELTGSYTDEKQADLAIQVYLAKQ
jgi:hypothetical protein